MATRKVIVLLLSLLAIQIASVACLDEDSSFDDTSYEDLLQHRNIRAVAIETTNELKAPGKFSLFSIVDSLVPKLLNTTLGKLVTEAVLDTPKFVLKVNSFLGRDVLILKGNSLRISFVNLTEILKIHANHFLEKNLKLQGVMLLISEGFVKNTLDDFSSKIKPVINRVNFTLSSKATNLQDPTQVSVKNVIRKLILDLVVILIRPFQSRINQTLINVTNELLSLYKPVLPNDYFKSIVTCGINQTILKALELIDSIRETINQLLSPSTNVKKRSVDDAPESNEKQTTSLIGLITAPIRFLLSLIFTPVHRSLKSTLNYVSVILRPIVGKVILSPIENIIMAIISLIPCLGC